MHTSMYNKKDCLFERYIIHFVFTIVPDTFCKKCINKKHDIKDKDLTKKFFLLQWTFKVLDKAS